MCYLRFVILTVGKCYFTSYTGNPAILFFNGHFLGCCVHCQLAEAQTDGQAGVHPADDGGVEEKAEGVPSFHARLQRAARPAAPGICTYLQRTV